MLLVAAAELMIFFGETDTNFFEVILYWGVGLRARANKLLLNEPFLLPYFYIFQVVFGVKIGLICAGPRNFTDLKLLWFGSDS